MERIKGGIKMAKKTGFTLIELLVVISIIALLMAIMMPGLRKAREQAKAVVCQSNLKQWCLIYKMYTQDNDSFFSSGWDKDGLWVDALRKYYANMPKIRNCPTVNKFATDMGLEWWQYAGPFVGWGRYNDTDSANPADADFEYYGSYGQNMWLYNPPDGKGAWYDSIPGKWMWRTTDVRGADKIPMFFDCSWRDAFPDEKTPPPRLDGGWGACVNRHNGYINVAFVDFSVRKIGLKWLWEYKWHRSYDVLQSTWTIEGGVEADMWPEWMQKFKDYSY